VSPIWKNCLSLLERELTAQQFNTWIKPLQLVNTADESVVYAPNKYILETVERQFSDKIREILRQEGLQTVDLKVGSQRVDETANRSPGRTSSQRKLGSINSNALKSDPSNRFSERESFYPLLGLNKTFTFDSFVGGRSNEMARAAAIQVSENVGGSSYNPLLLYGGVGLGKTHLMHAVGNAIADRHPDLKVAYMYSQRFMEDMVRAIEQGAMADFTQYYRSVDV
jgi:chromosomal replication initiator protein